MLLALGSLEVSGVSVLLIWADFGFRTKGQTWLDATKLLVRALASDCIWGLRFGFLHLRVWGVVFAGSGYPESHRKARKAPQ